jgi:hypothetical protein
MADDNNGREAQGKLGGWLLGAATPLVWGAVGAALALVLLPRLLIPAPALQLATVDIAGVMQGYSQAALRDPENRAAVGAALEAAGQAAGRLDGVLAQLAALHPGVVFIQPQALAYQPNVPDMTAEFRNLLAQQAAALPAPAPAMQPTAAPPAAPPPVLPLGQVMGVGGGQAPAPAQGVQPNQPALAAPPPEPAAPAQPSWDKP